MINAIGRAGRAGKETEGVVVLALQNPPGAADFQRLTPGDSDTQVISAFASDEALTALAEFEERVRSGEDDLFSIALPIVDEFLSFTWFIAAQMELLHGSVSIDGINNVLHKTLAWIQLSADNQERWISVASMVLPAYESTNPQSRKRWSQLGTSVNSARELESIARGLATVLSAGEIPKDPLEIITLVIRDGRLRKMFQLKEAPKTRVYTNRGGSRHLIEVPVDGILLQWIGGEELVTLADTYFTPVNDVDYRFEQLADFINDHFETYLPWIFGVVIGWCNAICRDSGIDKELPHYLPALIRWGVSSSPSVSLMIGGIRSRRLATKIVQTWGEEEREEDIKAWVRSMNILQWQEVFGASITELRSLLEFSRDQVKGVAVEFIRNEFAKVGVETTMENFPTATALLASTEDSELSPIGIFSGDQLLGHVMSRDQADIRSIMSSELPIELKFTAENGKGTLELKLIDPDAQLT